MSQLYRADPGVCYLYPPHQRPQRAQVARAIPFAETAGYPLRHGLADFARCSGRRLFGQRQPTPVALDHRYVPRAGSGADPLVAISPLLEVTLPLGPRSQPQDRS